MRGVDFLAQALISGNVFGVRPGMSLDAVTSTLGDKYVEELHGSQKPRLLRRDYGLLEVTFKGDPEWSCGWITVELHRLAGQPDLLRESSLSYGVEFQRFTQWSEVAEALGSTSREEAFKAGHLYVQCPGGVAIVVAEESVERDYFPGNGDLWKISIPC